MKQIKLFLTAGIFALCTTCAFSFEATVEKITGRVEIKDGSQWYSLEEGDVLEEGSVISTGYNSSAIIKVKASEFEIGPLTRLTIEELASTDSKDSVQLYIDSGSMSAQVANEEGKTVGFKTRSPVATASVRGTDFTYSADGKLQVRSGLTSLSAPEPRSKRGTADVKDGKSNIFTSTSAVGEAKGIPVYAGQSSAVDTYTNKKSSPLTEALKSASLNSSGTLTSSTAESESSSSTVTSVESNTVKTGGATVDVAEVIIRVTVK